MYGFRKFNAWIIKILEWQKRIYNQKHIFWLKKKVLLNLIKTGVKEFKEYVRIIDL